MIVLKDAEYSLPFQHINNCSTLEISLVPVFYYCNSQRIDKILIKGIDDRSVALQMYLNSYKTDFIYNTFYSQRKFDIRLESPVGNSILHNCFISSIKHNSFINQKDLIIELDILFDYFENSEVVGHEVS